MKSLLALALFAGTLAFGQFNGPVFPPPTSSGGTVTTVSCGNLSPVFSCTVNNPATTPAFVFTQSTFGAHLFYGNNTGSTAAPGADLIGASDISPNSFAVGTGTANAQVVTLAPAATALVQGLLVRWLPVAQNTSGTVTLSVNGLGSPPLLTKNGTSPLDPSDLNTLTIAYAIYDGTNFQLQNPANVWINSSQVVAPASDFICFHHGDTSFTFPGTVTACNSLTTDPTSNTAFNTGITIPANTLKAGRQARICSNQNLISNAGAGSIGSRFFVNSVSTVALSTTPAWTPLASATTPGAQFQECVDVIGTVATASSANVLFAQETTGFAANTYSIAGLLQRSATQPLAINTTIPNTFYFGIANVGSGVGAGITYASGSSACTNGTQTVAFTNGGGTAGAGTITVSGGVPSGAVTITNTGNTYTSVPTTGTITTCTGAATFTGGALAGSQGAGLWQQSLSMQPVGL